MVFILLDGEHLLVVRLGILIRKLGAIEHYIEDHASWQHAGFVTQTTVFDLELGRVVRNVKALKVPKKILSE